MLEPIIVLLLCTPPVLAGIFLARRLLKGNVPGGWIAEIAASALGAGLAALPIERQVRDLGSGADPSITLPEYALALMGGPFLACLLLRGLARKKPENNG